jgi:hypothetical protein
MRLAIFAVLAACSGGGSAGMHDDVDATPAPDTATTADATPLVDEDVDGLDDQVERQLAADYLPYLSLDPDDGCPRSGLVARVRPHPADPTKVLIVYSHLFEHDCGLAGHVGDNEAFGVAIDPAVPPPAGILAIRTASHQGTPCERVSECSTCGDSRTPCDVASVGGEMWPVLYASKDKHGQYAALSKCSLLGTCFDQCTLNEQRAVPPVLDVGEPTHAFTHDLTADGFITSANGWTEPALMSFDPWDPDTDFGGAGHIAGDLQDSEFEPAPCP